MMLGAAGGGHLSSEFFRLIKAIGETYSKQEENALMAREAGVLKEKLKGATVLPRARLKEFVIRCIYVEMLGHDASWGHMKAVELAASEKLSEKRTGYLACGAFLNPDDVFRVMLVNQLQRDLASSNFLEAAVALQACGVLATAEMVAPLSGLVARLARHDNAHVRKKALGTLHRFVELDYAGLVGEVADVFRRALCDAQPCVMAAALPPLEALIRRDANFFKDLVPSFVSIAKQIAEHRLPREYDYHHTPAPWIQLRVVRILGLLGKSDQAASEGAYEVLFEVMRRSDTGINAANAVLYECVKAVTTIYPNDALLEKSAAFIQRLLAPESALNSKYIGIKGLTAIVKVRPALGTRYQVAVIECLEHSDPTLRRQTLALLCRMANPQNVESIVETLVAALRDEADAFKKKELCHDTIAVAEKLAPSDTWYIRTLTEIFVICGDLVQGSTMQDLLTILAEAGADGNSDICIQAVEAFLEVLQDANDAESALPGILVQCVAWVLGEYGTWAESLAPKDVMKELATYAARVRGQPGQTDTLRMLATALTKLTATAGGCDGDVFEVLEDLGMASDVDLQQRCLEMKALVKEPTVYVQVFPVDASCEDLGVDESLTFLNEYVEAAMSQGAPRYDPVDFDELEEDEAAVAPTINFTPYSKPDMSSRPSALTAPQSASSMSRMPDASAGASNGTHAAPPVAPQAAAPAALPRTAGPWGRAPGPAPPQPGSGSAPAAGTYALPSGPPASSASSASPSTWRNSGSQGASAPGSSWAQAQQQAAEQERAEMEAEHLEKQARAAALFGGGGGGGGSQAGASKASTTGRRRQGATRRVRTPEDAVEGGIVLGAGPEKVGAREPASLLSEMPGAANGALDAAAPVAEQQGAPGEPVEVVSSMQDLLDAPVPATDMPLLMDLLTLGDAPASAAGAAPAAEPAEPAEPEDPFAGL